MSDRPNPPPAPTEPLARLVRQKRRLLEQLVESGRRQEILFESGDTGALLQLLSSKGQLIAALRVVEQGLAPHQSDDPNTRPWPSPEARAECAADAQACNALLAEAVALEERHAGMAEQRREQVGQQLRHAQAAHVASSAYKPHLRATAPAPDASDEPLATSLDLTTTS